MAPHLVAQIGKTVDLPARADALESSHARSLLERALREAADPASGLDSAESNSRVLDAAYELFCQYGIQRTTMEDVAGRAGMSRITVYRRMESKEALIERVVLREFRRYFDKFLEDISAARTVADRVVVGFVSSLRAIRSNPLIGGLMDKEAGALLPSVLGHDGHTMAVVSSFVAGQLRREQRAGHVAMGIDVEMVAEMMVRVSTSFLLTPSPRVDLGDDEQLADVARQFLVPMLHSHAAS